MTLDIEEFRIIKTLKEVLAKEIKSQQIETQLAIDSAYRDEKYKVKKIEKLTKLIKAMEWLEKQ